MFRKAVHARGDISLHEAIEEALSYWASLADDPEIQEYFAEEREKRLVNK